MLQELFSALNNDPNLIAETLVRSSLADRMVHGMISGVPTSGGKFNFTISVVDTRTCTKSHDYTINVFSTHP